MVHFTEEKQVCANYEHMYQNPSLIQICIVCAYSLFTDLSILPILHALTKNELFREYSNVYKLA